MNFLNLNSSFTYSQFASVPILQQCMGLTTICKNSLGIIKDLAVKILFKNIETDEEKLNLEYKTLSDFIALVDYYDSFLENPKFPIGHIKVELIDFIEKFDCEIKDKLIENSNNKIILNFAKELKPINMLNTENLFEIL